MFSRDLDLGSNQWDAEYATSQTIGIVSMNEATIGDRVYMFYAQEPQLADNHQYQSFYFTQRQQNDAAWSQPVFVTETTLGLGYTYMSNRMVAQNGSVYFLINCNYNFFIPPELQSCWLPSLTLWSYSPSSGLTPEGLFFGTSTIQTTSGASLLLSTWQNGVYAYWEGSPNGYNMRRKPFAITGTIASGRFLRATIG